MPHVELVGNDYCLRPCRIGDEIICAVHGLQVVGGFVGPRSWPRARVRGKPQLIVCDGLLAALKFESREAVSFHWGIHVATVANWRRALGLTDSLAEGVSRIRRQIMNFNRERWPESFVLPGVSYLNELTAEQRRELGCLTAGDRKWTRKELEALSEGDVKVLCQLLQRSAHSIRSARYRLTKGRPRDDQE